MAKKYSAKILKIDGLTLFSTPEQGVSFFLFWHRGCYTRRRLSGRLWKTGTGNEEGGVSAASHQPSKTSQALSMPSLGKEFLTS
ncbi:hypothetical protein SBA1_440011 [Candidatus Sulfotelmatobacter kueseliae]|uniref:Uncharacterized protein n=1 Tax=Candidatus Sulfotelmatobacter kueseliae TaxID=2042962 RepID=A0A2U3KRL6_9BACT|nr:hypothetical protein SBA1_440011 [Candidatus Sulfotelmatobacter kueseliae]